jgi:transposase-like protein
VIDGAKALDRAVRKVFGEAALIQRCTIHKRRNVTDHLPEAERGRVDAKLARAFANPDPGAGLRAARDLARTLQARHPGAAASLREGLEEVFTVRRLGVPDRLARTLTSTNPVESMTSTARTPCATPSAGKTARWYAAGPPPGSWLPSAASAALRAARTCPGWWPRWLVTPRR